MAPKHDNKQHADGTAEWEAVLGPMGLTVDDLPRIPLQPDPERGWIMLRDWWRPDDQAVAVLRPHLEAFNDPALFFLRQAGLTEDQKLYMLYILACMSGFYKKASSRISYRLARRLVLHLTEAFAVFVAHRQPDPASQREEQIAFNTMLHGLDWTAGAYFASGMIKEPWLDMTAEGMMIAPQWIPVFWGEYGVFGTDTKPEPKFGWDREFIWRALPEDGWDQTERIGVELDALAGEMKAEPPAEELLEEIAGLERRVKEKTR